MKRLEKVAAVLERVFTVVWILALFAFYIAGIIRIPDGIDDYLARVLVL